MPEVRTLAGPTLLEQIQESLPLRKVQQMKFTRSDLDVPVTLKCGCKILWHEGEMLHRGIYAWCEKHGDSSVAKLSHGGLREGGGRKPSPEPLKQVTITFYKSHLKYLRTIDPSPSIAIRKIIKGKDAKR